MKKYDLSLIMKKAWEIFRKAETTFAEALHRAWLSAKAVEINQNRIDRAKSAAGVKIHGVGGRSWGMRFYTVVNLYLVLT